jgi:amino acid transporter
MLENVPGTDAEHSAPAAPTVQRLRQNAIGLPGVLFMAVATAAPIAAMVANVPIAIGFGIGANAPAGYIVATIVLGLFALGYSAMAKHITATGAFYGFISHGLGRVLGMGAGALTTMAYMVFEASLVGLFSFFAHSFVHNHLGWDVPWLVFALAMLAVNAVLTYFDVTLTAKVLGVFLVGEIAMLLLMAAGILVYGGGPQGWSLQSLNPINAFHGLHQVVTDPTNSHATIVATGTAGIGLFFAFWSWVGFESTAMYGEESRNPKKIIPIATMVAVLGIGVFYVFISWIAIVGTGPDNAVSLAQNADTASEIFFGPARAHLGQWAVDLFEFLLVTGSYACGMAFHNCASRYLYAIGRENLVLGFAATLGSTHKKYRSPHIAGFVQTGVATVIVVWFFVTGRDPYTSLFAAMGLLGTSAILIVQTLAAFAAIAYFHFHHKHPESANWFRTLLAPLLGGIGMIYVTYLLFANSTFLAGTGATDIVFTLNPWIVAATGLGGLIFAVFCKYRAPDRYESIGRIVLEDTRERDETATPHP